MLYLFSITIFLSAFLLFQVQPVIGRFILPWFGSAPGVWATCMLFFQALLLLGYSYAHFVVTRIPPRRQAIVHGLLLGLAVLTLPITPDSAWKPLDGEYPVPRITLILALSVGVPYLLLSSTGPLLQGWFARLSSTSPYRLYALSNAGSLLALLSYPVMIEPSLALSSQTMAWSAGFGVFALLCACCAWRFARDAAPAPLVAPEYSDAPPPGAMEMLIWLALATCGSGMLLATTNQLSQDVTVVPFLWVLPLALYLLSFIICFDHDRWYLRPLLVGLLPLAAVNGVRLLEGGIHLDIRDQVSGYALVLFVVCMCCHGEMARRRPPQQYLTLFFLVLAIGGALGGLLVAIVAPAVFSNYYEFPVALALSCIAVSIAVARDIALRKATVETGWRRLLAALAWTLSALVIVAACLVVLLPGNWLLDQVSDSTEVVFSSWLTITRLAAGLGVLLVAAVVVGLSRLGLLPTQGRTLLAHRLFWGGGASIATLGLVCLVAVLIWLPQPEQQLHVARDRNFYGVLAIKEYDYGRYPRIGLKHGRIRHGIQLYDHPDWPASYYGPASGVGVALQLHPARAIPDYPFRVAVVGLGAGVLAAYSNAEIGGSQSINDFARVERREPPDLMRFYELNPMVVDWAEGKFSYLRDARARGATVETRIGDARIVLERELSDAGSQQFDVLIVDAFTGDAIPIHLLSRESLQLYWSHLKKDGILALHVSNLYIDVKPVVHRLALELGYSLVYSKNRDVDRFSIDGASWMLLTRNERFLARDEVHRYEREPPEPGPLWTDDYSAVFSLLRYDD